MSKTKKVRMFVLLGVIFVHAVKLAAAQDELYHFRSGVHLGSERPLSTKEAETLVTGIRMWTGLDHIVFEPNGNLRLNDSANVTGGSRAARELIIAAAASGDSFTLERHDNSPNIAFAQIESTDCYIDSSGQRHNVWRLRIDFEDFTKLSGNNKALAAFDVTASVVHELTHGVYGCLDLIDDRDQLGGCERFVNQMRSELGLPLRLFYYPQNIKAVNPDGSGFVRSELRFNFERAEKDKELFVSFNAEKIFDFSRAKSKTAIRSELLAQKRMRVF